MALLEVSVRVDGEAAEAVGELFNRLGTGGAVVEEVLAGTGLIEGDLARPDADSPYEGRNLTVKAYLPVDDRLNARRRAIEVGLWHLGRLYHIPPPEFRELQEDDWAYAWKSFHPVQQVGKSLVLKPTWREYQSQPGDVVIDLDPGMAFGTGQHPSTRLCLLALERLVRPAMRVLDVGTGSGILAIAAAKLGVGEVVACDIDPVAVEVARANVALNRLADRVRVGIGSLDTLELEPGAWDLIVVNILAPVIVELLPLARPLLRAGGHIVLAGLIATQEDAVRARLAEVGLSVAERDQEGDWVLLVGQSDKTSKSRDAQAMVRDEIADPADQRQHDGDR